MLWIVLCTLTLTSSAKFSHHNLWSMETAEQVTGREGEATVLFCKFTHPRSRYNGNITVKWFKENKEIFSYINHPTQNATGKKHQKQVILNINDRYQVWGNPRKNEASIIIKQLNEEDTKDKYCCRVELNGIQGAGYQLEHGNLIMRGQSDSRAVTGMRGDSVTLSCTFNPPQRSLSSLTVLWMKRDRKKFSTVFNDTRSPGAGPAYTDSVTVNEGGRYELNGNPTQGDASLRMRNLQLNDTDDYFCHVHIRNGNQENVTQDVMRLQVVVPATILELLAASNDVTGESIVCRVEAVPPANITWIDPDGSSVPGNSPDTTVTREPEKHQTIGEFRNPTLRGAYNCVAVNELGGDIRQIRLTTEAKDKSIIVPYIVRVLLMILFFIIGFIIWVLKIGKYHSKNVTAARD